MNFQLFNPGANLPLVYTGNFGAFDRKMLYYNPGTLSNADGREWVAPANAGLALACDVSTVGIGGWTERPGWASPFLGGMDVALPTNADADLYFYVVRNDAGDLALIASQSNSYGQLQTRLPAGWVFVRQMHFATKYKPIAYGGLPDFFQDIDCSHVELISTGYEPKYMVGSVTPLTERKVISLADWIVNDVRTVRLFCDVWYDAKVGAGTGYLGNVAQNRLWSIGEVGPYHTHHTSERTVKLDSQSQFVCGTCGGAGISFYLQAWRFDSPT